MTGVYGLGLPCLKCAAKRHFGLSSLSGSDDDVGDGGAFSGGNSNDKTQDGRGDGVTNFDGATRV